MAQKVREVMTADPATVDGSPPATEAAALMRERDSALADTSAAPANR
jgi:CBS domain-containing protein